MIRLRRVVDRKEGLFAGFSRGLEGLVCVFLAACSRLLGCKGHLKSWSCRIRFNEIEGGLISTEISRLAVFLVRADERCLAEEMEEFLIKEFGSLLRLNELVLDVVLMVS